MQPVGSAGRPCQHGATRRECALHGSSKRSGRFSRNTGGTTLPPCASCCSPQIPKLCAVQPRRDSSITILGDTHVRNVCAPAPAAVHALPGLGVRRHAAAVRGHGDGQVGRTDGLGALDTMLRPVCHARPAREGRKGGFVALGIMIWPVCLQGLPGREARLRDAIRVICTPLAVLPAHGCAHPDLRWPKTVCQTLLGDGVLPVLRLQHANRVRGTQWRMHLCRLGSRLRTDRDMHRLGRLRVEWSVAKHPPLSAAAQQLVATTLPIPLQRCGRQPMPCCRRRGLVLGLG
jgi:hypothetical protein